MCVKQSRPVSPTQLLLSGPGPSHATNNREKTWAQVGLSSTQLGVVVPGASWPRLWLQGQGCGHQGTTSTPGCQWGSGLCCCPDLVLKGQQHRRPPRIARTMEPVSHSSGSPESQAPPDTRHCPFLSGSDSCFSLEAISGPPLSVLYR